MSDWKGAKVLEPLLKPMASLHPDPQNVRRHDQRNLDTIGKSLERFGQQKPIVVDQAGLIVAGNGTFQAAASLGWSQIAVVSTRMSVRERRAYAIADNRTAELATWDDDALAKALKSMDEEMLEATGFMAEDVLVVAGELPPNADGKVVDESIASGVIMQECPHCGHKFPK